MATPAFVRLIREWNASVSAVSRIVGSRQRALAAVEGLKLQEYYGECFASYRFLGKRGGLSNKAVQRMMDQLEEAGLIKRVRHVRGPGARAASGKPLGGTLGEYIVDWSGLWAKVAAALNQLAVQVWTWLRKEGLKASDVKLAHVDGGPEGWVKVGGFWVQSPGPPG